MAATRTGGLSTDALQAGRVAPDTAGAPTGADLKRLAAELAADFDRACRSGLIEADARFAGSRVRLRYASERLHALQAPAFHRLSPPEEPGPEMTVCVWETQSRALVGDWRARLRAVAPAAAAPQVVSGSMTAVLQPEVGNLVVVDADAGTAWFTVPAGGPMGWWELGSPLRPALHRLLSAKGLTLMHAGAVAAGDRGALITGRGGSGKSTLALACLDHGLDYVGEDYVVLESGPPPRAHLIYTTAKLDAPSLELLPRMRAAAISSAGEGGVKAVLDLARDFGESMRASTAVHAIVLPDVHGGARGARLVRVPASAAVLALAPTSTLHSHDPAGSALAMAAAVARTVPTYRLELGEPAAGARAVAELLEGSIA